MRTKANESQRLALSVYVKLMRATSVVTAKIHRHLQGAELTASQFGVLEALHHLGPLCQGELSQKVLKSSANLTSVVDALEGRGLVERDRTSADRRKVKVALTAAGESLIEDLFARHAEVTAAEFSILSVAEQKELGRLLRKLGRKE